MRVALDLTAVRGYTTGVENVVLHAARALVERDSDIEWTAYLRPEIAVHLDPRRARIHAVKGLTRLSRVAWQQLQLPRLLHHHRVDLLVAPIYTAPLATRCPIVLFVHDTIALERPDLCSRTSVVHLRTLMTASVRKAWRVVVPSQDVAEAVRSRFEPGHEPVVLEHGVGDTVRCQPTAEELAATRRRFDLPQRFLLGVGRLERRKNQAALVDALTLLRHPDGAALGLVLVGADGPGAETVRRAIRSSPARHRIRRLGWIEDRELAHLYRMSIALVFPSLKEGFGIPPLESLCSGTPAIVSRHTPSYIERWGADEWVLAETDPSTIARRIDQLLDAPDSATRVASRQQLIRGMTWQKHSMELSKLIGSVNSA